MRTVKAPLAGNDGANPGRMCLRTAEVRPGRRDRARRCASGDRPVRTCRPPRGRAFRRPAPAGMDALALAQGPQIILLDEPTTFLDLAHQVDVLDLLRELNVTRGHTIALVLHDLNLVARYANHPPRIPGSPGPPRSFPAARDVRTPRHVAAQIASPAPDAVVVPFDDLGQQHPGHPRTRSAARRARRRRRRAGPPACPRHPNRRAAPPRQRRTHRPPHRRPARHRAPPRAVEAGRRRSARPRLMIDVVRPGDRAQRALSPA
jgi:LmbE family N-acetylglucosaminyl deacetylase